MSQAALGPHIDYQYMYMSESSSGLSESGQRSVLLSSFVTDAGFPKEGPGAARVRVLISA